MRTRRFILGTAGHVDHGKTQLVSKLTGWDTDRLKEEKQRGISIELGFAPLRLADDIAIGVVDVPGHERFIKNMVAGAGGIDLVLLLIAGDEGVMPQTREHLEVLRSLRVTYGVVVISKTDLAIAELTEILEDDIAELVAGTFLEGAPVVNTSAKTGQGLDELKSVLTELCRQIPERDATGPFRLAVDRVFQKRGIGLVVTGSCYSGTVRVGDSLELLPSRKIVRVRELQSFGARLDTGYAGERLAIALQGRKLGDTIRGEMLVTPDCFDVSYMIDARIQLASYAPFELKQRERIRVHHGAREVLGRVVLLDAEKLCSGDDGLVQLRLEAPVVAGDGDDFVIRKYSPTRVLGGGQVIDPQPMKHRRFDEQVLDNLHLREVGDPEERVAALLKEAGTQGVAADGFDRQIVNTLIERGEAVTLERLLFHAGALDTLAHEIQVISRKYSAAHPLRYGIDKEELRQRVKFPHGAALFNRVLGRMEQAGQVYIKDSFVRPDTHEIKLADRVAREISQLEATIRTSGLLFQKQADLENSWRSEHAFMDAIQYLRDQKRIEKVGADGYVHSAPLAECIQRVREWFDANESLGVSEFKDLFSITRKHAIPWLEFLDENRVTSRRGNVRVQGSGLRTSRDE